MNGQVGLVTPDGLLIKGNDGKQVCVSLLSVEGKFVKAGKYGQASEGGNNTELSLSLTIYLNIIKQLFESSVSVVDGCEAISGFSHNSFQGYASRKQRKSC